MCSSYQLGSADQHTEESVGHSGPTQVTCQLPASTGAIAAEMRKVCGFDRMRESGGGGVFSWND